MAKKTNKKKPHSQKAATNQKSSAANPQAKGVAKLSVPAAEPFTREGKIVWVILLILVALIPLAMSNATAFGFSQAFTADIYDTFKITFLRIGVAFALAFWLLDLLKNGGKLRFTPLYYVVGGFLAVSLVSTFTSVSPLISLFGKYRRYEGLWTYVIYASVFFLTIQYAFTFERVKTLARTLSYTSAVVALYGLLQAMGIEPFMGELGFEAGRSYSTLGNPDFLAGFLAFGVFITIGLILVEKNTGHRVGYWLILLLNAIVTITAYARSIWVGVFVGAIALVVILVLSKTRLEKIDLGFLGGIGAVIAAIVASSLSSAEQVTNFAERVSSIFKFGEGSALTRFLIWESAVDAIKDRPILGFGADTFRLVFRRYQPPTYAKYAGYQSVADNVHNYILQLAAGIGIFGMLLFYGLGLLIAILSFPILIGKKHEKTGIDKTQGLLYAGFWLAALGYMVHLFFGISLSGTTFLLFLCYGVLIAPLCKTRSIEPVKIGIRYALVVVGFLFAGFVSIASFSFMLADGAFMSAEIAKSRGDLSQTLHHLDRACTLNPFNDYYRSNRFQAYSGLAILSAQGQIPGLSGGAMATEEINGNIAKADSLAIETIDFNPWEYDNYPLVVAYYTQIGQATQNPYYFDQAIALAEEQIPKTPEALSLRYAYALVLTEVDRNDEARGELEFCIERDPNFEAARKILAEMTE